MWTLRQRLQPGFRAIAGVVLSLWLVATTVCTLHCAGPLASTSNSSRTCCHRDPSPSTQSFTGSTSHQVPINSSKKGPSGCLKEYLVGKRAQLAALQLTDSSQILWRTPFGQGRDSRSASSLAATSPCDVVPQSLSWGAAYAHSHLLVTSTEVARARIARQPSPVSRIARFSFAPSCFLAAECMINLQLKNSPRGNR